MTALNFYLLFMKPANLELSFFLRDHLSETSILNIETQGLNGLGITRFFFGMSGTMFAELRVWVKTDSSKNVS